MSDVVIVAIITGLASLVSVIIPTIANRHSGISKKVDDLAAKVEKIGKMQKELGDIVYQMLDHMATNNNTGNMKRCLDQYNEFSRHN